MKVLGIDPGTRSFDLVLVEDGRVLWEYSIDTATIAFKPDALIDVISRLDIDYIVAPSGYGVPVTFGDEVLNPQRFIVELLLLSSFSDLARSLELKIMGGYVYQSLANTVSILIDRYKGRVLFIPAVIHLPTVPWYRKINKVDMGTVDKLAATLIAIDYVSRRENIDYDNVSIINVEVGYGYIGVVAVRGGKIVDGIGGSYASIGLLTTGALDLEVACGVREWNRWDVWSGGVYELVEEKDLDEIIRRAEQGESKMIEYVEAIVENIVKDIARELVVTPKTTIITLTGRYVRNKKILDMIRDKIRDVEVTTVNGIRGATRVKEAAQGYAAIGEGVVGEYYRKLVEHTEINKACGTVADYIIHPRALEMKEKIQRVYREVVAKPKLCI
ncbi:MAG: DUF1464 family protein [Acidilobaceae archaeon]